mgnify:CR=1 FL=1
MDNPPRVRLLGWPALLGPPERRWSAERRWRLAGRLALADDALHRDQLAELFWPDRSQAAARSNLRKLLMELRALGLPGLVFDGPLLRWPVDSDVLALQRGEVGTTPWAAPLQGLEGGDSPAWDDWLRAERSRLQARWRDAVLQVALRGPVADRWPLAEQLIAADPLDEAAHRLAADALRAAGREADAERLLAVLARRLAIDFGLAAMPAASPVADEGLVGRARVLQQAQALLGDPDGRLLTLTGPGGMGKSALALELLRREGAAGHRRACWVALEDLGDLAQVWLRLARELGLGLAAGSDGAAECCAALAGAPTLLVLDNAEHLPALDGLVSRLLDAAPPLVCLCTSRSPLGLAAERRLTLPPLDDDAAMALFVREARHAGSRWDLAADHPALRAVVDRLGGLPLALRLAAAWTRHLGPQALQAELARALDLLEQSGSADERPQHAGLRATFDLSWTLLDGPLRRALTALSVTVGPTALAQAAEVADAPVAALRELADRSWLDIDESARVSLHPLVRAYAAERLAADAVAAAAARQRHKACFAAVVAPYQNFSKADTQQAYRCIREAWPNLLQAWQQAIADVDARAMATLAPALSNLVQAQGGVAALRPGFAQAEALLEGHEDLDARWRVSLERAALEYWVPDYDAVERSARRALAAARACRQAPPQRQALNTLALAAMRRGRLAEGVRWGSQALSRARADGAAHEQAAYAGNLSALLRELGRLDEARALALESRDLHRQQGFALGEVSVLNELGLIAHAQGRLAEAFDHYRQALQRVDEQGLHGRRAALLSHQASVRLDEGEPAQAQQLLLAALQQLQQHGPRSHEATARRLLAEALAAQGQWAAAVPELGRALVLTPLQPASSASRGLLASAACLAQARGLPGVAVALLGGQGGGHLGPLRYRRLREDLAGTPAAAGEAAALLQALLADDQALAGPPVQA